MSRGQLLAAVIACLVIPPAVAMAQVVARQGEAPPPQEKHFASPMILEIPLPNVTAIEPGSSLRLADVHKNVCDNDVTLRGLTVAKEYRGPRRARALQLVVAGAVLVTDSYDRRVDIALRLRSGDKVIGTAMLRNHAAEEERSSPFRILLPVDEPTLTAALAAEPRPTLELTLTVRDDS